MNDFGWVEDLMNAPGWVEALGQVRYGMVKLEQIKSVLPYF